MMVEQEAPGKHSPPGQQPQGQNPSDVTNLESGAGEEWRVPEVTHVSEAAWGSQGGQKDPMLQDWEPVL